MPDSNITPFAIDNPIGSTDNVWYKEDLNTSLSEVLDDMAVDISDLNSTKANISHTHSGYATAIHQHSGYASSDHQHSDYAPTSHSHTGYASSSHTHSGYAMSEHTHADLVAEFDEIYDLLATSKVGGVKENLSSVDVLATIAGKPGGMYTFYATAGAVNNPRSAYAYRYIVHKSDANYGWLLAFGSDGSIFSNYLNGAGGNWKGWKPIYDQNPIALWTGNLLMSASETVTPSKSLSSCANGWILEWSDYDVDDNTANNWNMVQTIVYKKRGGSNWDGENAAFAIANYISDAGANPNVAVKQLKIYNNKLEGHIANTANTHNNDVCLRAVYEF